jgi:cytidylate kinase
MLITISRQYGAGGSEVAARVAASLGWRVVDNELVERVAARAGITPEDVAEREERVSTFIERLARTVVAATPELVVPPEAGGTAPPSLSEADLVRVTERVVEEVAAEGRVVLVGRAAPAVLARERDAIHVKVVAPREWRIRIIAERLSLPVETAAARVDETDRNRARYHRQHYQRDWSDPANYHLVLNTAALGLEGAADVVVGRSRALGWLGEPGP